MMYTSGLVVFKNYNQFDFNVISFNNIRARFDVVVSININSFNIYNFPSAYYTLSYKFIINISNNINEYLKFKIND